MSRSVRETENKSVSKITINALPLTFTALQIRLSCRSYHQMAHVSVNETLHTP